MTEVIDYGSRRNKLFTSRRALDTGDENDFAVELDKEFLLSYQYSKSQNHFDQHTSFFEPFRLVLLSDGQTVKGWDALL